MVVENCPAHLQITGLNAIKLIFATKYYKQNTTHGSGRFSELKSSLKAHEKQADSTYISVLDALRPFSKSWASVTEKTIVFATQTLTTLQSEERSGSEEKVKDPDDDIPLAVLRLRVPSEDSAQRRPGRHDL